MKRSTLIQLVREVLTETSTTNTGGATMKAGEGAAKGHVGAFGTDETKNKATKSSKKDGLKVVKRPKRPTSTKLIDYI
jgi:hypothetical protein|tara:strand:- start:1121 stop:1354 length:234 start_codon:yes stop_codon:yes gene_type:complete